MVPRSILDLSPIVEGGDAAQALRHTVDLAQHAERWGYQRFWLAEHHSIPSVASAATAVVIARVAGATTTLRVGAGGIMLPNHAPLVVAEQFGTLETMFPGRIELGLGRAPGSDQATAAALRRTLVGDVDRFPQDVVELMAYFEPPAPGRRVRAIPGEGLRVPIWILGSSLFGARLAAELGLPYAFASHFAPAQLLPALDEYRRRFKPSARLAAPRAMVGVNVVVAGTDADARRLFTSHQQAFVNLRRGEPGPLPPPVDDIETRLAPFERAMVDEVLSVSVVGSPDTVRRGLDALVARVGPDELIAVSQIYDYEARLRSFELLSGI
ncbi:MAG: LLM class flavin-dependent oxidoreductase [Vicinamibacteraceae bacterium]|nr:LLM class flavin-dependent oxidoreductase [Vicinamibacteraceae bacterium]